MRYRASDSLIGFAAGTAVIGILAMILLWQPLIGPWSQERRGLADLREAQMNRQIRVEEAEAEKQAQILFAQGEVEASRLRAEAINVIGAAAQEFPEYRQQEFIGAFAEAVRSGKIAQMIYVPTEAGIPITEARNPQP